MIEKLCKAHHINIAKNSNHHQRFVAHSLKTLISTKGTGTTTKNLYSANNHIV
jgi:hypothetical protein